MSSSLARFLETLRPLPMPELRKDPVTGTWVIVAPDRAQRPNHLEPPPQSRGRDDCPFCPGRETETPPEILAYREAGTPPNSAGWRLRVVPNRFPALRLEEEAQHWSDGFCDALSGVGAHEVIVESPLHVASLTALSGENIRQVLGVYRDRLLALKKDKRLVYGLVFKNVGAAAGASLEHTHSQLIGLPIVPIAVWEEMTGALGFFNQQGRCIFCEIIRRERHGGQRLILDSPGFASVAPFASRFPFETWLIPRRHSSHFEELHQEEVDELAGQLKTLLHKLESALDQPAYNYIIHTSPFDAPALPHYHWHIEIIPRVTRLAGFEWGTGFYINPVPPEQAAEFLRQTHAEP